MEARHVELGDWLISRQPLLLERVLQTLIVSAVHVTSITSLQAEGVSVCMAWLRGCQRQKSSLRLKVLHPSSRSSDPEAVKVRFTFSWLLKTFPNLKPTTEASTLIFSWVPWHQSHSCWM